MLTLPEILATFSPKRNAEVEARAQALIEEERRRIYFRAGEVITCENGHELADVVEDTTKHQEPRAAQFANWRNVERPLRPSDKPQLMRCTACGARFCMANETGGAIFHVGTKWRTDGPERWGLNPDETSRAA